MKSLYEANRRLGYMWKKCVTVYGRGWADL